MLFKFRKRSFLNSRYYLFGTEILINYAKKHQSFPGSTTIEAFEQKICIFQNDTQCCV